MAHKGASIEEISEKMGLSEWIVGAYLWRSKNPGKYKALLKRYQEKRKKKQIEKTSQEVPNEKKEESPKQKE